MAKRGGEAALKRAREKARQEKKEAKQERILARRAEAEDEEPVDEHALMEQFARLSESFQSNKISLETYEKERHRIFWALGIEDE